MVNSSTPVTRVCHFDQMIERLWLGAKVINALFISTHAFVLHLMLSDRLTPNRQSSSDRSCPPDSGLSTESSRAERARLRTPTLTTLTFWCDPTAHQPASAEIVLGFNRTLSTSPAPAWVVLNCKSTRVTYIHIWLPATAWYFHGNRSGRRAGTGWSRACVSAYMSVVVHLCLHRLQQSQSPNWIRAYGKVGEGRVGRRRREGGAQ